MVYPDWSLRRLAVLAVVLAVVLASGGVLTIVLLLSPTERTLPPAASRSAAPLVPLGQSGVDFGPDRVALTRTLPALLTGQATAGASQPVTGLTALRQPAALASCLNALLPPDTPEARPLALDYARYLGQPALVVVLPGSAPSHVEVFVVGAACSAQDEDLLFYTRLSKP